LASVPADSGNLCNLPCAIAQELHEAGRHLSGLCDRARSVRRDEGTHPAVSAAGTAVFCASRSTLNSAAAFAERSPAGRGRMPRSPTFGSVRRLTCHQTGRNPPCHLSHDGTPKTEALARPICRLHGCRRVCGSRRTSCVVAVGRTLAGCRRSGRASRYHRYFGGRSRRRGAGGSRPRAPGSCRPRRAFLGAAEAN